jgi:hypothetical protein
MKVMKRLAVEYSEENGVEYYLYIWVDKKEYKVCISEQEYEHMLYSEDVECCFS